MKYYVCEGTPEGKYNASTKAREDVEYILSKLGFEKFYIPTKYGVQKNKLLKFKQFIDYKKNFKIWTNTISKLQKGDILLIQYPLINTMLGFEKVMEKLQDLGVITILLIHDLDSLRFTNMPRIVKEDREVVKRASYIISHNNRMKNKIVEMCNIDVSKITDLKIFDYVMKGKVIEKERQKTDPIIIAGNLSKEKAKYLKYLKDIKDVEFNLYGKGYEKEEGEENINYKGAYLPEELVNNLDGGFGLVWDGGTLEECTGPYGEYLKYNNPHKISLYLTAGLPVIVWRKSAMAEFVLKNKVGIIIDKLEDLGNETRNITDEEYEEMKQNAKHISEELKEGKYLTQAINSVLLNI